MANPTNGNNTRQHVRRIFMEVADLPDADRAAALIKACGGDQTLCAEVEALLRTEKQAEGFMATPTADAGIVPGSLAAAAATIAGIPREQAGAQIGRYKLLQPIGEGGFGSVWMAEQREPVKRRVALKIIKLGMDTILGQGMVRIPEAPERLVKLYEATGNQPEAAAWRSKLEAAKVGGAEQAKAAAEGGQ